ncbi:MAG: flagellar M-ring protein FliF C-terminal domain-containing protein, partial [Beijerinckiaceae bacterium]
RVQVASELDFNRIQQTAESYDPESRVLRSTQTRTEASQSTDAREGQVTVGNELPGNQRGGGNAQVRDGSNKNEEVANYDYSKTVRTEVMESGRVKRVSVAVLVDGIYNRAANGETAYQPRPQEDLDRIAALVRTSIGFNKDRGDTVEVVNLRFAEPPRAVEINEPTGIWAFLQPSKEDIYRAIELGVLALLTLIVMFAVVRPLVNKVLAPEEIRKKIAQATGGMIGGDVATASAGGGTAALPGGASESAAAKIIELAKVNGAVQAQSIERIGEVVKSNPQEALAILRSMMNQNR